MSRIQLFDPTIQLLHKSMDLRSQNHQLIGSNIANADTPNFKAVHMNVEQTLQDPDPIHPQPGLRKTHPRHLGPDNSHMTILPEEEGDVAKLASSLHHDGNTVAIDHEMVKMAENGLLYQAQAQIIARKFGGLKQVIQGRQ